MRALQFLVVLSFWVHQSETAKHHSVHSNTTVVFIQASAKLVYANRGPARQEVELVETEDEDPAHKVDEKLQQPSSDPHWHPFGLPRHLWASGFDAKCQSVPSVPRDSPWLTWTPEAEKIFRDRYRDVHFPPEGCLERANTHGFISARTDLDWGVTSVLRDTGDQLLYGLLTGRYVAFSDEVDPRQSIQDAIKQYRSQCPGGNGSWMENCYFKPLTGCTAAFQMKMLPAPAEELDRRVYKITYDPAWFLEKSQPIWDAMVNASAIKWVPNEDEQKGTMRSELPVDIQAARRLAMFRSLMVKVAFQPNDALQEAIKGVEERTKLPEVAATGPITVLHIRRTDKSQDFADSAHKSNFDTSAGIEATLTTFADKLLPWMETSLGRHNALFVMSDDWHAFEPSALHFVMRKLLHPPKYVLFDEESLRLTPKDEKKLQMGNEAWGHKAELGRYILAASLALGKWASSIAGCGCSGVTQLVAQSIAGRMGVDPNSIGLWEDDALNVNATSPSSLMQGDIPGDKSSWWKPRDLSWWNPFRLLLLL